MSDQPRISQPLFQGSSQSTMDQPVASVEPSVKPQDHVTSAPHAEKQLDVPKNSFKRQGVLIINVRSEQADCEEDYGHVLGMPSKDMILCYNCGALWIR